MAARKRIFKIVLEPAEDKPKEWYVATSPNLRGLVTQGQGIDETVENVKDAIAALFRGRPPAYALEVKVLVPV
ncbi:MAG TPA: type II toxin-antitoxin system HicB family antitoxin [Thermoplasmata archaeon]|nr:type II toxin-antitoxin system HicB family antitoxin [Thermoplasmata archaeon]